MLEKVMTMLVGILLALAGWNLSRTFELSTTQAVLENQIDQLEFRVQMLDEKMDQMMSMDKEIMNQHEKLFKKLEQGNTSGGYSYN
jgi:conjugal transfer/entry exclusion protein